MDSQHHAKRWPKVSTKTYLAGKLTEEGAQSWTLWRIPDGRYELEDHFHLANAAAEFLGAVGQQHMNAQLQQEMSGEMAQTDIDVTLSADLKIESLTVKGTRLLDGKGVQLETCFVAGQEIRCKGQSGGAKLRNNEPREFFYSFPFPMLSVGLVQRSASEAGVAVPLKFSP